MRRILTTVVLALTASLVALVGLSGTSYAGGPTSVLVTQPGADAAALYYDDAAYDALAGLLPAEETRGKSLPPGGGGTDYNLTWMIHDVVPWRFDRVHVAPDGTAWVSTTFEAGATAAWEQVEAGEDLPRVLEEGPTQSAGPGRLVGPPTAGRRVEDEPRQVLLTSES